MKRLATCSILALCLAACGGSSDSGSSRSGSGGGGSSGSSLSITPNVTQMDLGDILALVLMNGAQTESGDWTTSDSGILSLSTTTGSSVAVTAEGAGVATIEARSGTSTASLTITVEDCTIPADPGPVYGNESGTVTQYPAIGGGAPSTVFTSPNGIHRGSVMNADGSQIFLVSQYQVFRIDTATNQATEIANFNGENGWNAMDVDSNGQLYTINLSSGEIKQIDPNTGAMSTDRFGATFQIVLAIGMNDERFTGPFVGTTGIPWLYSVDANNVPWAWANAPADVWPTSGGAGWGLVQSGTAVGSDGAQYTTATTDNRIFRHDDANMDGSALDAGETITYATLPFNQFEYFTFGISLSKCDTVLVNVIASQGNSAQSGAYWVRDMNNDGDAQDANETILFNAQETDNGWDTSCLIAPRQ